MTEKTIVIQDTLATAVTALINKTINGVDNTVAFMQAELPDYIVQLLMWHGIRSAVIASIALICIAVYLCMWKVLGTYDGRDPWFPRVLAGGLTLIGVALSFNLTWLQIWIAPKVWLVEYAASLVK